MLHHLYPDQHRQKSNKRNMFRLLVTQSHYLYLNHINEHVQSEESKDNQDVVKTDIQKTQIKNKVSYNFNDLQQFHFHIQAYIHTL